MLRRVIAVTYALFLWISSAILAVGQDRADSEWWLVGTGILTAAFIAWQSYETRKSAQATQLNVEAVIFAERPWLLIPMGQEFSDIDRPILITRLPGTVARSFCTFRLKNYGRSPARVIEQKLRLVIGGTENDLPSADPYQPHDAVREDYTFAQDVTTPIQATIYPDGMVSSKEFEDVFQKKTRAVWLCGYIKYTDTFARAVSPIYETRFCFRWNHEFTNLMDFDKKHSFWIMAGPLEYNKAT